MPRVYTVATKNAFAALDDDSDAEEAIQARPVVSPEAAAAAAAAASGKTGGKAQAERANRLPVGMTGAPGPSYSGAGGRGAPREGGPRDGGPREGGPRYSGPRQTAMGGADSRPARFSSDRAAAPGGAGAGAGAGAGGPPRDSARREFDRRSGTGRGRETKKEGGGAHNWGTEKDEQPNWRDGTTPAAADGTPAVAGASNELGEASGWGASDVAAAQGAPGAGPRAPVDEAPKTLTYAAWQAEMASKRLVRDEDGDAAPAMAEGYSLYTKDVVGGSQQPKSHAPEEPLYGEEMTGGDAGARGKRPMHFAGVSYRVDAGGRGRGQGGPRGSPSGGPPKNEGDDKVQAGGAPQAAPPAERREINLNDKSAFPTLEAH